MSVNKPKVIACASTIVIRLLTFIYNKKEKRYIR